MLLLFFICFVLADKGCQSSRICFEHYKIRQSPKDLDSKAQKGMNELEGRSTKLVN